MYLFLLTQRQLAIVYSYTEQINTSKENIYMSKPAPTYLPCDVHLCY